ncbi:pyridoxine 5'-phosphate synthase [Anaplasma capra]|uniref:pyridoxine 5'-phosphate synthase n=1 Tax=Anaplasma capra TaxID=1562740 RepID=UPI0021D60F10|nr:pyridoxine 5'-phosphate synthase [Anaplasma capra]MCU7611440.1 pyridoxine 5'-phosphate synthase [Anaplasma capra]MCU7612121.1 pyridoxine 5'-phosphate synthase [Anaplasma capra]
MQLGVNVDHVATLRNLRGTAYPDVVEIANEAVKCGADFVTVHLREDRRHIKDTDVFVLKNNLKVPMNLEMAATHEMLEIAKAVSPEYVCLVPEKREEITTESGVNAKDLFSVLAPIVAGLQQSGIGVTLFIEPDREQIDYAKKLRADKVELHVGAYCLSRSQNELQRIADAAAYSHSEGMECHAGHGINYETAAAIAKIQHVSALNVGHFLICESLLHGMGNAVRNMKKIISG